MLTKMAIHGSYSVKFVGSMNLKKAMIVEGILELMICKDMAIMGDGWT